MGREPGPEVVEGEVDRLDGSKEGLVMEVAEGEAEVGTWRGSKLGFLGEEGAGER